MIFLKVSSFQKIKLGLLRYLWRNALRLYVYSILFYGGKSTALKGDMQGRGGFFCRGGGVQIVFERNRRREKRLPAATIDEKAHYRDGMGLVRVR